MQSSKILSLSLGDTISQSATFSFYVLSGSRSAEGLWHGPAERWEDCIPLILMRHQKIQQPLARSLPLPMLPEGRHAGGESAMIQATGPLTEDSGVQGRKEPGF